MKKVLICSIALVLVLAGCGVSSKKEAKPQAEKQRQEVKKETNNNSVKVNGQRVEIESSEQATGTQAEEASEENALNVEIEAGEQNLETVDGNAQIQTDESDVEVDEEGNVNIKVEDLDLAL